jgi:outer membrane protein insertion porin family
LNTTSRKGSSQIELQGGYGGGGFIGTLGLSFNNFSARNLLIRKRMGQKVSLRLQASTFFRLTAFRFQNRGLDKKTSPIQFFDIVQ